MGESSSRPVGRSVIARRPRRHRHRPTRTGPWPSDTPGLRPGCPAPSVPLLKGEAVYKYLSFRRVHPDGIHIAFDDRRLVANAGLILPATLAFPPGPTRNWLTGGAWAWAAPRPCLSVVSLDRVLSMPITQISGCEALALQYGADCITSVGAELRQEPRR